MLTSITYTARAPYRAYTDTCGIETLVHCKSLTKVTTALEPAIKNWKLAQQFSTKVEFILTLPYNTHQTYEYFWIKHDLGQKYYARGLNSRPSDHDNTFHVTETPALTTWPSVTSKPGTFELIALCAKYY